MNDESNDARRTDAALDQEIADALGEMSVEDLMDSQSPEPADNTKADEAEAPETVGTRDLRKGRIIAIRGDDVFVDLGGKDQGVVPVTQFDKPPKIGDMTEFLLDEYLEDEGLWRVSRQGAAEAVSWDRLEKGMIVEGRVTGMNTGGLELRIAGQRAFMPASQVDTQHIEDMTQFLNEKLRCQVVELNKRKKNVVVSRRAVLEEEAKRARVKLMEDLEEGQMREGTVRNLRPFGAFVDLGGLDGLIHVSDLSYSRVKDPSEVVEVGQKVTVKVMKIDLENDRISLGLKQVKPDPWEAVQYKYPAGAEVTGTVTRTAHFGAFVEVEPGVEGLIPISEVSWSRINRVEDVLSEGQSVRASVLSVEPEKNRLTLSIKQVAGDPWRQADRAYTPGAVVKGRVTRATGFGAFVELEPGIEGLIHISELAEGRVDRVESVVKVGEEIEVKVLDLDPDKRRISLSIRALTASDEEQNRGNASKDDVRKYLTDENEARARESLMGKFGDPNKGGLKGGIG